MMESGTGTRVVLGLFLVQQGEPLRLQQVGDLKGMKRPLESQYGLNGSQECIPAFVQTLALYRHNLLSAEDTLDWDSQMLGSIRLILCLRQGPSCNVSRAESTAASHCDRSICSNSAGVEQRCRGGGSTTDVATVEGIWQ